METRKETKKMRVVIALSVLLLFFLAEPLLAKKNRNTKSKNETAVSKQQNVKEQSNPSPKPKSRPRSRSKSRSEADRKVSADSGRSRRRSAPSATALRSNQSRRNRNRGNRSSVRANSRRSISRNRPVISAPKKQKTIVNVIRTKSSGPKTVERKSSRKNRWAKITKRPQIVKSTPASGPTVATSTKKSNHRSVIYVNRGRNTWRTPPIKKQKKFAKNRTGKAPNIPIIKRKTGRNRPAQKKVMRLLKTGTLPASGKKRGRHLAEVPVIRDRKNGGPRRQHKFRRGTATTREVLNNNHSSVLVKNTARHGKRHRSGRGSSITYEDRRHRNGPRRRYEHVYRNRHNRISHRIIWPRFSYRVRYDWGRRFAYRDVYPYYHRKYVFVSLGGYWPLDYRYMRYYWYPSHFYCWYGYDPIACEPSETSNYYTYNYYYGDDTYAGDYDQYQGIAPVDHNTFAEVREKLASQQQEPLASTLADTYFEQAVKAFEEGDYAFAAEKFAEAGELAPEDVILPFAYAQALFADEQYTMAAEIIRLALENLSPQEQGVFYPRGLYPDEELLFEQIDCLVEKAEMFPSSPGLQLLLGYHLLGIGEVQEAIEPLEEVSQDIENSVAATILLELAEQITADNEANQ